MDRSGTGAGLGGDEQHGFHDIYLPLQVKPDAAEQPFKPAGHRFHFHSSSLFQTLQFRYSRISDMSYYLLRKQARMEISNKEIYIVSDDQIFNHEK